MSDRIDRKRINDIYARLVDELKLYESMLDMYGIKRQAAPEELWDEWDGSVRDERWIILDTLDALKDEVLDRVVEAHQDAMTDQQIASS